MINRILALTAASAIATLAATGAAFADPSGYLSLGVGPEYFTADYGGGEETADGYAVQGRASGVYDFTPVLSVQGDVVFSYDRLEYDSDETDRRGVDVALHGFYREADQFLVGAFIQLGRDGLYYNGNHEIDVDRAYVGGEAQVYIDNLTLYAQGGMQQLHYDDPNAPSFDGWFGSVEARSFLTPDFRIDAHAGLSTLSIGYDDYDVTTLNIGIGAEYKIENTPISLFAKYDLYNSTYDGGMGSDTSTQHRILFGATFAIGEDSLMSRDRSGASLKPVDSTFFGGGPS